MKQYLEILDEVIRKGTWKESARENMPRTISRFGIMKRFDLQEGFPLLTTKRVHWSGVIHELIWFLRGDTNINYLHKNGVVKMWHEDAYRWYLKTSSNKDTHVRSFDEWFSALDDEEYALKFGSMGKIYGYQWRNFTCVGSEGKVYHLDQISSVINSLLTDPYGRYKVVTAWNPGETALGALPPCHMLFQFNCRPMILSERFRYWKKRDNLDTVKSFVEECGPDDSNFEVDTAILDMNNVPKFYIDCMLVQRSCDTFLGVPFNIASYAALVHVMGKFANMVPGDFVWCGNDVHIYENHLEQVDIQMRRRPRKLPQLVLHGDWGTTSDIEFSDFELVGYDPHPKIDAKLSTGLR